MNAIQPDKKTAAVCGLLCNACGIYIATQENNLEHMQSIAARLQIPLEKVSCNDCRSEQLSAHRKDCQFRDCASKKGIEFCSQCPEYPCNQLTEFQSKMPHRTELFHSLELLKEKGWENWFVDMVERHSCTHCHTLNGWYELACRKCGTQPSSPFVADNQNILSSFYKKS